MLRFYIVFFFSVFMTCASPVLAKSPIFSDFTVTEIYKGKNHVAQKGDEYRFDSLKQVLKTGKVNFAGHYIIYMDSCGSGGCILYSIVDAKTGKNIASIPTLYMGDVEDKYTPNIEHKVNSKLIHVSGVNAEKFSQYQDDYYILDNNKLKKISGTVQIIKNE